jgi:hypothetical protein
LGDSEDEAVKEANNDHNKSIGSSVSSGGLLEKDMVNLMHQDVANETRKRRFDRRKNIERNRLNRTASH